VLVKTLPLAALLALTLGGPIVGPSAGQSLLKNQPPRVSVDVTAPARPVKVGEALSLTLRITPKPGLHVYAPGNPDYIAVAIEITPVSGISVKPALFPPAEDLFFAPLKETIKVYTKSFDVRLPLQLEPSIAKGRTASSFLVTVAGRVAYQACDDRVCFPPQSEPFSARVAVRANRS
jgi:DsbC/DsbD-like thiol-disulfide interchange protein